MNSYAKFALMLIINTAVMFVLTMAFVNSWDHFHLNISNFYMALLMVAPMAILMLVLMGGMFPNKALNMALILGFALLFVAALWLGRAEVLVGDEQFLRAMIPHHSRAILVCEQAAITDPEIVRLCGQIIDSQQREIDQMQQILSRY
ncbi:DUF305 domain-containing protein [Telmatospirillum sp. J64-1]|uniref:DUF305 domain-containing protein n=1 Tax=Telmatospirillum sp. J64-1 TaxID=2502183 RepID=UPI00115DFCAE|nr:DUF305 domain-containing protein [Telmatospirillum sp. J64-1]